MTLPTISFKSLHVTGSCVLITFLVLANKVLNSDCLEQANITVPEFSQNNNAEVDDHEIYPESEENLPCSDLRGYAFHNETKKCWPVGAKGPCPDLMKFFVDPENEGYGDCDCVQIKNCIGRPRTYWPKTDRCYFIYSRGPCQSGQWIVFNKQRKPECVANPCGKQVRNQQRALDFLFPHEDKCHRTGTKAFCDEGKTVYISSSDLKPRCFTVKPVCRFLIFAAQTLSCRPGSKLDVTDKCAHMREMEDEE